MDKKFKNLTFILITILFLFFIFLLIQDTIDWNYVPAKRTEYIDLFVLILIISGLCLAIVALFVYISFKYKSKKLKIVSVVFFITIIICAICVINIAFINTWENTMLESPVPMNKHVSFRILMIYSVVYLVMLIILSLSTQKICKIREKK